MIRESAIRKALKLRVEAYGGEIRAVAYLGRRHCPDVLALFPEKCQYTKTIVENYRRGEPGYFELLHPLIETKRPGKDASEGQAREHVRLREAGFVVLVITTHEELDVWLPPL